MKINVTVHSTVYRKKYFDVGPTLPSPGTVSKFQTSMCNLSEFISCKRKKTNLKRFKFQPYMHLNFFTLTGGYMPQMNSGFPLREKGKENLDFCPQWNKSWLHRWVLFTKEWKVSEWCIHLFPWDEGFQWKISAHISK